MKASEPLENVCFRQIAACRMLSAAIGLLLLICGCSKHTADGVDIWGDVSWGGKSIPNGRVTITPDTTKGNSGHQGWAFIKDGRFDTRWSSGKFAPKGACIISITNKQKSTDPAHPKGTDLILKYDQPVDIPAESAEMNLEVPSSFEAIVSLPDGAE